MDLQTPHPNPHLSFEDTLSLFVCLITCLLASLHAFFPCLLVRISSFLCLFSLLVCFMLSILLYYLSTCLLLVFPLFVACMNKAQVQLLNASKKGKDQQISRLSLSMGSPLSLSIFFQNHVYSFLDSGSFSSTLLYVFAISKHALFVFLACLLHALCVGNVLFTFLIYVFALCMMNTWSVGVIALGVQVCDQGLCCRCIFVSHCVYDYHNVIASIHVSQWHWFPYVYDTHQCFDTSISHGLPQYEHTDTCRIHIYENLLQIPYFVHT